MSMEEEKNEKILKAMEVKEKYLPYLMSLDGVVGVAIGMENEDIVIIVNVEKINENLRSKIPEHLNGFKVKIVETGIIKKLGDENEDKV